MTVQTNTNVATFNGNGVTQIFPIGFKFNNDTDLVVLLIDDATGAASQLVLNSDYTVSGEGDENGGLINVVVAPATGQRLKVTRLVDILQLMDLRNQGKFFAEVHEDAFDLLTMIAQQHDSGIKSALRVAESDPEPARLPAAAERAGKILGFSETGEPTAIVPVTDSSAALRVDLASSVGALLVGYRGKSLDFYQGLKVSPYAYGAVGDGIADDTVPVQQAIDAITAAGGGTLELFGRFLAGGLIVDTPYVLITGRSERDQLIVKNGTLGVHVKQHWVNFENITVKSEGSKGDGLNTNGILYERGGNLSTGFVFNQNLTVLNFSGYGVKVVNAISYSWKRCYVLSCTTGVSFARDAGNLSFSTTVFFDNVYVTSCTTGIKGDRLYRSHFNVIGESCDYAMDMFVGDFTLYRCYFEKNFIRGVRAQNCAVQDLWTYSNNATTDAVSITFQDGVVGNLDRGYVRQNQYDMIAKRLAVLTAYGVDPQYLSGHGTTQNLGMKFGEATVALVRGPNLLSPLYWASNRATEFVGWHHIKQGYEISGTSAGDLTHGMQQTVTLDSSKTYVLDFRYTPINGTISTLRVGSDVVTSGVPFKPSANGANVVKAFGSSGGTGVAFEMYVHSFTLAEVVADPTQVAEANDRLTRQKDGRGAMYDVAAPASGSWRRGERVYHAAPSAGGFIGWVCTASGSPGTWKTFGAITA